MLDNQLRLHPENLALFLDPTLKRTSVGFYSVSDTQRYKADDSEKANLVALKEIEKAARGITEYEVPQYIESLNLAKGYQRYSDKYDKPDQGCLIEWLQEHPSVCQDVDVVCSHQVATSVFKAPYTEASAIPWEVKVVRGPDGICYLTENEESRVRYSEMNIRGKQQVFRQRSFKRYMTVRKGKHAHGGPPPNYGSAFYRVNKVRLDSGTIVYQSEVQCFDINYNAIDLKVQLEGQYDLPAPSVRLNWWSQSFLAGSRCLLSGYCGSTGDSDDDDDDESTLSRLISFDIDHIKPQMIREAKFDEETCIASLCTFVQFVKDLTANGKVASCVIRFEPGSKRLCVLDIVARRPSLASLPGFKTQLSAADETSSVETTPANTPRTEQPGTDELLAAKPANGLHGSLPRLRQVNVNEVNLRHSFPRKSSVASEMAAAAAVADDDNDEDKYKPKRRQRRGATGDEEDEMNWFHIGIILIFMAIALIIIPIVIDRMHTAM